MSKTKADARAAVPERARRDEVLRFLDAMRELLLGRASELTARGAGPTGENGAPDHPPRREPVGGAPSP